LKVKIRPAAVILCGAAPGVRATFYRASLQTPGAERVPFHDLIDDEMMW